MRVIATGRYSQRSYQDRDGNNRIATELSIDEIGPSLRYAQAAVQRVQRGHTPQYSPAQAQADEAWADPQADAPFNTPSQAGTGRPATDGQQAWTLPADEEAPF